MKELFTKVRGTHEMEYNSLGLIIASVVTSSGSLGIWMESTLEAATGRKYGFWQRVSHNTLWPSKREDGA